MFRLDDRVALVTAAGRGIGLTTALALAEQGANVAINDLDPSLAESAAERIRGMGRRALALPADATDEEQAGAMVERAAAELGRIDILVNNVGGSTGSSKPLEQLTLDDWERVQRINVTAMFLCTRAALSHLKVRGGRIVNISSLAGVSRSILGGAAYAAAKAAVLGFTRHLSGELGPYKITVNAIAPGLTMTDRVLHAFLEQPAERQREVMSRVPLGRPGQPEDQAAAIVYLCSDEAGYITGATLDINGGINVR
jgi:NAD(P)-dependent dehydrogenase (short-subunit alcohol dehydrogenase family)